jgi:hypothetical protein
MMRRWILIGAFALAAGGCGSTGEKVLQDFGIKDRPEGYVSGADKVMQNLPEVAKVEIDRLNAAQRQGEILYEKVDALNGAYYKRIKVYETSRPLDAQATTRTSRSDEMGFVGYIEYGYQFYESARKQTKTEAAAQSADISTGRRGQETYRYRFNSGSVWNGGKGERFKE